MRLYFPVLLLALVACSSNDKNDALLADSSAVVSTRSADFSSGAHSVVGLQAPFAASNGLDAVASSDIVIRGGVGHFYRLQRFGSNTISRYEMGSPATPSYSYSTDSAEESNSNPYDIIEVSSAKAYVLRYGAGKLWVVNPSAASEAEFLLREIDLGGFDPDGVPEMATAVLQNDRLYLGLQLLENFSAVRDSVVAVIDVPSDSVVDLDPTVEGPQGITLPLRNLTELVLNPDSGDLLALAQGGFDDNFAPVYDGGIARVDLASQSASLLLDDGDAGNAPYGQLQALVVASDQRAYFVAGAAFAAASLYALNPSDGSVGSAPVAGLADVNLGDISLDSSGRLWVARLADDAPGLTVLAADDRVLIERVDTLLLPTRIDFLR